MKKYITKTLIVFKLSFLSTLFVGCDKGSKPATEPKKRTAILDATSIEYSTPAKTPLNSTKIDRLKEELNNMLTYQLESINTKEATQFDKQTLFCDLDGEKVIVNQGEIQEHQQSISFEQCQEEERLQDGNILLEYAQADEDGRYPKSLRLDANTTYTFNELKLTKGSYIVVNNIHYNQALEVDAFDLKISGEIYIGEEQYQLENFTQLIRP